MKAHLMYPDRDFDSEAKLSAQQQTLIQDLELDTLFQAMAGGDKLILEVVRRAVTGGLAAPEEILYRQSILRDCIKNPDVVRTLYKIASDAIQKKKDIWWITSGMFLSSVLSGAVNLLQMFAGMLKMLRGVADKHAGQFESEGFSALFSMLQRELDDEYFALLQTHLHELKFYDGILIGAELGGHNQGVHYMLRRQQDKKLRRLKWYFAPSFSVNPRDENGCTDLAKRRDRALNLATNAVAQSADHVCNFFIMLQTELAFYVGCLNVYERLAAKGEPVCFPEPSGCRTRRHAFGGLYDISLALILGQRVAGNRLDADDKELFVITGANQGGKSTFLRSIGQAQLLMQCGMFVPAERFAANICSKVFTHYKRQEDATMKSGKLDEELARMSGIVDEIEPDSMILFNESFAATNEREGSEIGRQIVNALLEKHMKVFFVTHLYDFAHSYYEKELPGAIFLRAGRQPDGRRTFQLAEGEPLQTSFGDDLYAKIFENAPDKPAV